jgi:hypothetical protein
MRWPRASAPPRRCETPSDRLSPRQRDDGRVRRKLDQAGKSPRRRFQVIVRRETGQNHGQP